jgi:hypothetical protein
MKPNSACKILGTISLAVLFILLVPTARAQDETRCSNVTVAGKWGFTTNGTVVGIGPRDSLGIFTLDEAGNLLNGKATASLNGSITDEAFSGTYTVNPDCTGKLTIEIFDLLGNKILTATLAIVFDDNVRELRAMFTSAVLPNGTPLATVITVQAKRVFPQSNNSQ